MTAEAQSSDDGGQVLVLVLVYVLIAVSLVAVVASASAVHLERKRLLALADAAALDAADALDIAAFYRRGASPQSGVPLTDASILASVDDYVDLAAARDRFTGFAVAPSTGTSDGRTAHVTFVARARPPLVGPVLAPFSDGVPLRVTSTARARLGGG